MKPRVNAARYLPAGCLECGRRLRPGEFVCARCSDGRARARPHERKRAREIRREIQPR